MGSEICSGGRKEMELPTDPCLLLEVARMRWFVGILVYWCTGLPFNSTVFTYRLIC